MNKSELYEEVKRLKYENEELKKRMAIIEGAVKEIHWMGRRYAEGRSTYAPYQFNKAVDACLNVGVKFHNLESERDIYARDGMFGNWSREKQTFIRDVIEISEGN